MTPITHPVFRILPHAELIVKIIIAAVAIFLGMPALVLVCPFFVP